MADSEHGTVLTRSNPECGCRLRIEEPCPTATPIGARVVMDFEVTPTD